MTTARVGGISDHMIKNVIPGGTRWIVIAILVLAGCSRVRADTQGPPGYQGVVEYSERLIGFEVGGRLMQVTAERGAHLPAGAVVATLDDSLVRPARDARTQDVQAARARLELLRAGSRPSDVRAAEAQVQAARAVEQGLSTDLARIRTMAERGAAAEQGMSQLQAQLARATAERQAAEQRVQTLRNGARPQEIAAARAQLSAAEDGVAAEEQRLARYRLALPQEATVLDVHFDPGEVVAPGSPVVTVADVRTPYVDVFVAEGEVGAIRVGQAVDVKVDAFPRPFPGRVETVFRRAEFTPRFLFSPRDRPNLVLRVRVRVEDPQARLHAGLPAFVTVRNAASAPPAPAGSP